MRMVPPLWVIVLLALLLWGGEFALRGLWEPDEARYAYVAQEMQLSGHWLVPHINGELYPDKPPLLFWLSNLASLISCGRINGVTARLPSLFGSIMSLWAVTRMMDRWHSPQAAWRAMLVLMTNYLFWHEGGWGRIDALLCGLVMMGIYLLYRSLDENSSSFRYELAAYLFGGLAMLAKGPVGLMVIMGAFAAGAFWSGAGDRLKRWHWLWGPLVAFLIPGVWLLLVWLQHPPSEYFASMFGAGLFKRAVSSPSHSKPIYYFAWHFAVEFLPWTLFLPGVLVVMSDRWLKRCLLGGLLFVIGVFSLFVCKRNVYILAAYPFAAMLVGAGWSDLVKLNQRYVRFAGGVVIGFVCMLAVTLMVAAFAVELPFAGWRLMPSAGLLLLGGGVLLHEFRKNMLSQRWLVVFALTLFAVQISVSAMIMPAVNGMKGPVEAAAVAAELTETDEPVYLYRQQLAIFPLYASRRGRELHSVDELISLSQSRTNAVVVFRQQPWSKLASVIQRVTDVHSFRMGHKQLYLVQFREPIRDITEVRRAAVEGENAEH